MAYELLSFYFYFAHSIAQPALDPHETENEKWSHHSYLKVYNPCIEVQMQCYN